MKLTPLRLFAFSSVSMVTLWLLWWRFAAEKFGGVSNAGIFGDMFGGFSALINAVLLAGAIATLYSQSRQLDEERQARKSAEAGQLAQLEEERRTRQATDERQEKQLGIMQEQLKTFSDQLTLERQRFETTLEPVFEFRSFDIGPQRYVLKISNAGGAIVGLAQTEGRPRVELGDAHHIEIGNEAHLTIAPPAISAERVFFTLAYTTVANRNRKTQRFVLEHGRLPARAVESDK